MIKLDTFLFWTYLFSIILIVLVIVIIALAWGQYFPRKMLILLIVSFITSIVGLCFLFIAEITAPYSDDFYFNPLFYLLYLCLYGFTMFAIYQLVMEVYFSHVKWLKIIGYLGFLEVAIFFALTLISHLTLSLTSYPITFDMLLASVFGLGVLAYFLLAIGCFKDAKSDRLEAKHRRGLVLLGIFGLLVAFGISIIFWGIYDTDFSVAPDPIASAYWLIWIDIVVIIFLIAVRKAVKIIT